jgi:DNA-binding FadR family transcriptional regulator
MSNYAALTPVEAKAPSVVVDEAIVAALAARLPAQSKEMVQEHLGISANTWLKIRKGQPIRRSTAETLVRRIVPHRLSEA